MRGCRPAEPRSCSSPRVRLSARFSLSGRCKPTSRNCSMCALPSLYSPSVRGCLTSILIVNASDTARWSDLWKECTADIEKWYKRFFVTQYNVSCQYTSKHDASWCRWVNFLYTAILRWDCEWIKWSSSFDFRIYQYLFVNCYYVGFNRLMHDTVVATL